LIHHAAPSFWRCYHALPPAVRKLADEKFTLLKSDPSHPSLHFKRIRQFYSVRVGRHYRSLRGRRVWLCFAVVAVAGCTAEPPIPDGLDADAARVLTLLEDFRIGSAEDPSRGFSTIRSVDVDRDGNIYVGDAHEREIRVYGPDGQLLRRIGRAGSGPGEFEQPPIVGLTRDTVWAIESNRRRISLFNRAGDFLQSGAFEPVRVELPPPRRGFGIIRPVRMRSDGTFDGDMTSIAWSSDDPASNLKDGDPPRIPRVRFTASGRVIDTIGWAESSPLLGPEAPHVMVQEIRYDLLGPASIGDPALSLLDGRLVVDAPAAPESGTGQFHIIRRGLPDGPGQRVSFRYVPQRYTDAMLDSTAWFIARNSGVRRAEEGAETALVDSNALVRTIRGAMQWPAFRPPLQAYFIGAGEELWLKREGRAGTHQRWLVLDTDDAVRGVATLAPSASIKWARGDQVLVVETDDDDIPWLVRYRIAAPGSGAA